MPLHHFSRRLRACVLSWLLMAMAVALAAPLLHDGPLDLVCSGSGQMKLVQVGGDADHPATLDCPNCLHLGPLPASQTPACNRATANTTPRLPEQCGDHASFDTGPPPARGPPEN
jgi:hypothetical protein